MLVLQTSCFPNVLIPNRELDFAQSKEPTKLFNSITGIYHLAISALEHFKAEKLDEFDSLATDCSCHLRALKISILVQDFFAFHSSLYSELNQTLEELKAKQAILKKVGEDLTLWCKKGKKLTEPLAPIVSALQKLKTHRLNNSYSFPFYDILEQLNVRIHISSDLMYVIYGFTLRLVKDYQIVEPIIDSKNGELQQVKCMDPLCGSIIHASDHVKKEVTNLKNLTQYVKTSLKPIGEMNEGIIKKDVYRLAKKHLTDLSVNCILQETAKLLDDNTYFYLSQSQKIIEGKIELPDFYSLTGTFKVCLKRQIPVLLKVKRCVHAHRYQELDNPFDFSIYLNPCKEEMKFKCCSFLKIDMNGPLIVVEAKRSGQSVLGETTIDYAERLMNHFDFMQICEWDGAQHKQYTSDSDSLLQIPSQVIPFLKENPVEGNRLDALRSEAEAVGCAFSNQSLLILSHIFADTIQNQKTEISSLANHIQFNPEEKPFQSEEL